MKRRLKENKKKGFTLVELIVVLVILAILAALLIPALVGYIDKAKTKQIIAETRASVMAAQTLADEEYVKGTSDTDIETKLNATTNNPVQALAETNAIPSGIDIDGGVVKELVYAHDGKTCTYKSDWGGTPTTDGKYNVVP